MTMQLLVGTRSPGKTREILELFQSLPFTLVVPADLGLEPLPEEDDLESTDSFHENAVLKARYFAKRSGGLATVAEDSGLEVDALDGAPGPRSARWSGVRGPGTDEANNRLLVERLKGVPEAARTARYRCVAVFLAAPGASPKWVEAVTEGRILRAPRGTGGFGYDPLFYSTELGMTFAEASPAAKQRVSHRGRAFRALIELVLRQYGSESG